MKKVFILALACVCTAGAVSAQDSTSHKMHKMGDHKMHKMGDHKMKDCVMMKDGKVMVMKDGQTNELTDDMSLSNGSTVMKDGTVKSSDGKTMMMKDGDCVGLNGKWMGNMSKMHKGKMKMKEKEEMTTDSAK